MRQLQSCPHTNSRSVIYSTPISDLDLSAKRKPCSAGRLRRPRAALCFHLAGTVVHVCPLCVPSSLPLSSGMSTHAPQAHKHPDVSPHVDRPSNARPADDRRTPAHTHARTRTRSNCRSCSPIAPSRGGARRARLSWKRSRRTGAWRGAPHQAQTHSVPTSSSSSTREVDGAASGSSHVGPTGL